MMSIVTSSRPSNGLASTVSVLTLIFMLSREVRMDGTIRVVWVV